MATAAAEPAPAPAGPLETMLREGKSPALAVQEQKRKKAASPRASSPRASPKAASPKPPNPKKLLPPSEAPIVSMPHHHHHPPAPPLPPPGWYPYPPPHLYPYGPPPPPGPPPPAGKDGVPPGPVHVPGYPYGPPPPGYPPYGAPMYPPPPYPGAPPGAPWQAKEGEAKDGEKPGGKEAEKTGGTDGSQAEMERSEEEAKEGNNAKAEEGGAEPKEEGAKEGEISKEGDGAADAPPTASKPKEAKAEDAATPATVDETMSTISPQDDGPPTVHHVCHTHPKPPPHGTTPPFSVGSFSRITGPPGSAHYYGPPPPPPGSALRAPGMPPPLPHPSPYAYQYQHFDPRSHVDGPGGGYYAVPPTVHMPATGGPMIGPTDVSPLPHFSAIKVGPPPRNGGPATPEGTKGEGEVKGSPLDLLSAVSEGKGNAVGSAVPPPGGAAPYPPYGHPPYGYPAPPPPGVRMTFPPAPHHDRRPPPVHTGSGAAVAAGGTTPSPKSGTSMDLLLSAATDKLDVENGRKRRIAEGEAKEVRKRLHTGAAARGANQFYPAPGRAPPHNKPPTKAEAAKMLDPTIITQGEKARVLAEQALEHPRLGKKLLLSMALCRTNPRTPPSCYPAHGTILADRFHWAAFPPLDSILRKHMREYYELSTDKCQSRDQQEFNNMLVEKIKDEAQKYGWEFDDKVFDDKKLRDRVRCFYKTHIQNAKKRLKTMLRNPEKRANVKALAEHYHLIEEKAAEEAGRGVEEDGDGSEDGEEGGDGLGLGLGKSGSAEGGEADNMTEV